MSKTSVKARLAMIQAFANFMDSGSQGATVIFYESEQPETPTVAADSAKALVTLTFPKPCIKEVTASYVELYPTNSAIVIKTGTAMWARVYNGAGEAAADLTIGTDITLANTILTIGGNLSISSFKMKP